jgi:response regulator RpfG family c-di-GMP phosphodiesterase
LIQAEKDLLEKTLSGSIKLLTDILSMTDPQAFGRAQRLREEVRAVAAWFKAPQTWELELGAMLSEIGHVAIPPQVLGKARNGDPLSVVEQDMIARAPALGAELLANIPRLETVAEIVRYQHKNFDGAGFPADRTQGENIPIGARILRVLSDLIDFEAKGKPRGRALQAMQQEPGRYDPKVLEAVASCFDVYLESTGAAQSRPKPFKDLAVGDVLVADLRTIDGTLLVTRGNCITALLLQKLVNFAELSGIEEPVHVRVIG